METEKKGLETAGSKLRMTLIYETLQSDILHCRMGDALYAQISTLGSTHRNVVLAAYDKALKINPKCSSALNGVALLRDGIVSSELDCSTAVKELAKNNTVVSLYIKALYLDMRNSYAAVNLAMSITSRSQFPSSLDI
jgi:hypothetical protein